MGFLNEVVGGLETQAGQHAALYEEIAALVTQSGGVNGMIQKFEQNGLGQIASSWVGAASNTPITADQIIQVIGPAKIAEIAARVGLTEPQVADGIAELLPVIIAHLTPNGAAPATSGGQLETEALGLLKSKLFGV